MPPSFVREEGVLRAEKTQQDRDFSKALLITPKYKNYKNNHSKDTNKFY